MLKSNVYLLSYKRAIDSYYQNIYILFFSYEKKRFYNSIHLFAHMKRIESISLNAQESKQKTLLFIFERIKIIITKKSFLRCCFFLLLMCCVIFFKKITCLYMFMFYVLNPV